MWSQSQKAAREVNQLIKGAIYRRRSAEQSADQFSSSFRVIQGLRIKNAAFEFGLAQLADSLAQEQRPELGACLVGVREYFNHVTTQLLKLYHNSMSFRISFENGKRQQSTVGVFEQGSAKADYKKSLELWLEETAFAEEENSRLRNNYIRQVDRILKERMVFKEEGARLTEKALLSIEQHLDGTVQMFQDMGSQIEGSGVTAQLEKVSVRSVERIKQDYELNQMRVLNRLYSKLRRYFRLRGERVDCETQAGRDLSISNHQIQSYVITIRARDKAIAQLKAAKLSEAKALGATVQSLEQQIKTLRLQLTKLLERRLARSLTQVLKLVVYPEQQQAEEAFEDPRLGELQHLLAMKSLEVGKLSEQLALLMRPKDRKALTIKNVVRWTENPIKKRTVFKSSKSQLSSFSSSSKSEFRQLAAVQVCSIKLLPAEKEQLQERIPQTQDRMVQTQDQMRVKIEQQLIQELPAEQGAAQKQMRSKYGERKEVPDRIRQRVTLHIQQQISQIVPVEPKPRRDKQLRTMEPRAISAFQEKQKRRGVSTQTWTESRQSSAQTDYVQQQPRVVEVEVFPARPQILNAASQTYSMMLRRVVLPEKPESTDKSFPTQELLHQLRYLLWVKSFPERDNILQQLKKICGVFKALPLTKGLPRQLYSEHEGISLEQLLFAVDRAEAIEREAALHPREVKVHCVNKRKVSQPLESRLKFVKMAVEDDRALRQQLRRLKRVKSEQVERVGSCHESFLPAIQQLSERASEA